MKKGPRNFKEYSAAIMELANTYLMIEDCPDCGWPKTAGYQCPFCDETVQERLGADRKATIEQWTNSL